MAVKMPGELKEFSLRKTTSYIIKKLRKFFKPKRTPRGCGYHRLISDEEQRFKTLLKMACSVISCLQVVGWICRKGHPTAHQDWNTLLWLINSSFTRKLSYWKVCNVFNCKNNFLTLYITLNIYIQYQKIILKVPT